MSATGTGTEEYFRKILSREEFTPEEERELTAIAESVEFEPKRVILAEGSVNDRLYFLIDGKVTVIRSGEEITSMSNPGDLLGEMSWITGKPCSASIVAETKVSLLAIETGKVKALSPKLQSRFSSVLNGLFATILAQKLVGASEKARLFEITNRELKKAKKALEEAGIEKIDELTANQRVLFRKLNALFKDELGPIREGLEKIPAAAPMAARMRSLVDEYEKLAKAYQGGPALQDRKVLMVEDDVNEQINAKMSLGGTGVKFQVVGSAEEAKAALAESKFDIICVSDRFVGLIGEAKAANPGAKFVFVTTHALAEHFDTLRANPELTTILVRDPQDRLFTVKNTATTIRKLSGAGDDLFGIEKYLSWGTEIHETAVTHSEKRVEILERLTDYLKGMDIRTPMVKRCTRVAEELLMNVIYDAPHDSDGKPIYNHLSREVPIELAPEQAGVFRYACDGSFVAVSTEDPFGQLSRSTILNYLERCLKGSIGDDIAGKGGGGNGLFQIIQSSSLVVFNVRPGEKTEVIALFNMNIQLAKQAVHPSFHFFEA